jgi:hypothetical protein
VAAPSFWLEPIAIVDIVAGWCSWNSGISLKVGCSETSMVVDIVWVGGWAIDWFWAEVWSKPWSGWRRSLCHLGGIIGVVPRFNPWWVPNDGIK